VVTLRSTGSECDRQVGCVVLVVASHLTPTYSSGSDVFDGDFLSSFSVNPQYLLETYSKQTGIDLISHPSTHKLRSCHTSEAVFQLLQEREAAFKDYRNKNRKLINCLHPVIQVVHGFSRVLGEVAGIVSSGNWL